MARQAGDAMALRIPSRGASPSWHDDAPLSPIDTNAAKT